MEIPELNVVTGASGYTGKYITRRLLALGKRVRTLTRHPDRPSSFGSPIEVARLDFEHSLELVKSLEGATTLYNTYWIRFPYGQASFEKAVANTKVLIQAAEAAHVRKIVHLSVTNASEHSPLPYFRGKGILERGIICSKLGYAIIRPTLIFGAEDILINNIAWLLRHFPVFAVPGSGQYRLQPVFVEDVAAVAVSAAHRADNIIVDAVGPETYTFDELVHLIARVVRSRARIIHLAPGLALLLSRLVSYAVRDMILTHEELEGLMANLLISENAPTGQTGLSKWLGQNAGSVGARYASELARHYR